MSTVGILAELEKQREAELMERASHDILGSEGSETKRMKHYKLALRKKGAGSLLRQALSQNADPEELELLRQLKFVKESS